MKISVSLPEAAVAKLDEYAQEHRLGSRSAAVKHAIDLLWQPALEDDYAAAWAEWEESGEAETWSSTSADGLVDAAR